MCPAYGHHHHYMVPPSLRTCWITGCYEAVDAESIGLCGDHLAELREATPAELTALVAANPE